MIAVVVLMYIALALTPAIRMLNFKIYSIDRALGGTQFNITEKTRLFELKNRYITERRILTSESE